MKATIAFLLFMVCGTPALAATFVYVSNADDGEIGTYTMQRDGSLKPGQRIKAERIVMPMAVSPDKRLLIAAVRSKPYQAYSYLIDPGSGELKLIGIGPWQKAFPTSRSTAASDFCSGRPTAPIS
jgi:6-phosphogluconolactonase